MTPAPGSLGSGPRLVSEPKAWFSFTPIVPKRACFQERAERRIVIRLWGAARAGVGVGAHLVLSQRLLGAAVLLHPIATGSGMSVSTRLRWEQGGCGGPRTPTPWHTCQSGARGGQGLRRRGLSWTASISAGKETPGRGRGRKADHPSFHGPCSAQGTLDRGQAGRRRRRGPPSACGGTAGALACGLPHAHPADHALTLSGALGWERGPASCGPWRLEHRDKGRTGGPRVQ